MLTPLLAKAENRRLLLPAEPETLEALRARASAAWERGQPLVAREYLPLRLTGVTVTGFPHAREYRFIVLDNDVLARAF